MKLSRCRWISAPGCQKPGNTLRIEGLYGKYYDEFELEKAEIYVQITLSAMKV